MAHCRCFFFFQAEDGIRDVAVTGVQTCALPICLVAAAFRLRVFGPGVEIYSPPSTGLSPGLLAPRVEQALHEPPPLVLASQGEQIVPVLRDQLPNLRSPIFHEGGYVPFECVDGSHGAREKAGIRKEARNGWRGSSSGT